jgi:hypothetical protein
MIIQFLSNSYIVDWKIDEDTDKYFIKYENHALIDEREYNVYSIDSSDGTKIWLKDLKTNTEIREGEFFKMVKSIWRDDSRLYFHNNGKEGEVLLYNGDEVFNVIFQDENDNLVCNSDFKEFKEIAELIEGDFNVIKYLGELINNKDVLEGDLDLSNLEEVPDLIYKIISKLRGKLTLSSLKILNDNTAQVLSKHTGMLDLSGLKSLSDTAADYLSQHSGNIDLRGLDSISDNAANHLSKHAGVLNLENLENISNKGIAFLLNHKGAILCKGEFYSSHRKLNSTSIRYDKVLYDENNLSFIYLNINPQNGICIDFIKNIDCTLEVILDKKNTIPITDFLKALGLNSIEILNLFNISYNEIKNDGRELMKVIDKRFAASICRTFMEDFIDEDTAEIFTFERSVVLFYVNDIISTSVVEQIVKLPDERFYVLGDISVPEKSEIFINSSLMGSACNITEAQEKLYRLINENDAVENEIAKNFSDNFSDGNTINLGIEARNILNNLFNNTESQGDGLYKSDYVEIVRFLINK